MACIFSRTTRHLAAQKQLIGQLTGAPLVRTFRGYTAAISNLCGGPTLPAYWSDPCKESAIGKRPQVAVPSSHAGGSYNYTTNAQQQVVSVAQLAACHATNADLALVSSHQGIRWSYEELTSKVLRFASALEDLGYKEGSKLVMVMGNNAENVVAQLAVALLGCNLHTLKSVEGLEALAKESEYRGVLVSNDDKVAAKEVRSKCHHDPIIVGGSFFDAPDCLHFEVLCGSYPPYQPGSSDTSSPSLYFYNSAKGTKVDKLLSQGVGTISELSLKPSDRLCVPVTLNHSMGFGFGALAALRSGCSLVLPSPTPDPQATIQALKDEKCSILFADSHTLKAMPEGEAGSKAFEGLEALRGGLTKVGSGEAIGVGENRLFAGVGLVTVGNPPAAK